MKRSTELMQLLAPISSLIKDLDISSPEECQSKLEQEFPIGGDQLKAIRSSLREGIAEGELAAREHNGIRFGRLHKAEAADDIGIEIVHMGCKGPGHTHPRGEFDLCFAVEGEALFDGNPQGWTVYGEQSWHTPDVTKGSMDIIYFLPGGEIRFEEK